MPVDIDIVQGCDPGIQETVRYLMEAGFDTCDSGDGRAKYESAGWDPESCPAAPCPHVWLSPVDTEAEADALAARLQAALDARPDLPVKGVLVMPPAQSQDDTILGYVVGAVGDDTEYAAQYDAYLRKWGIAMDEEGASCG